VLADVGSIPTASTSIQKQSPAGASRWGFVFEYPHAQMEIETTLAAATLRWRSHSPPLANPTILCQSSSIDSLLKHHTAKCHRGPT